MTCKRLAPELQMTCIWLAHDLLDLFCDNYDKKLKSIQQQYNTIQQQNQDWDMTSSSYATSRIKTSCTTLSEMCYEIEYNSVNLGMVPMCSLGYD